MQKANAASKGSSDEEEMEEEDDQDSKTSSLADRDPNDSSKKGLTEVSEPSDEAGNLVAVVNSFQ
jgi:hypothetical protein